MQPHNFNNNRPYIEETNPQRLLKVHMSAPDYLYHGMLYEK